MRLWRMNSAPNVRSAVLTSTGIEAGAVHGGFAAAGTSR
jgi:hypothetical protein